MASDPFVRPPEGWAPKSAGLTLRQLAGIGFVVTAWGTLESILQIVLFQLAQSPATLGQSLTEDLGPDNRLKALQRLCSTWIMVLADEHPEISDHIRAIAALGRWIEQSKAARNQIAHWNWMRTTDESMFGQKYSLKPVPQDAASKNVERGKTLTVLELFTFGAEINAKTGELIALQRKTVELPTWPGSTGARGQLADVIADQVQQDTATRLNHRGSNLNLSAGLSRLG